jgi:uncharacterized phage-associated protein
MTVSVLAAAKWLCERSGWSLSNLELQKLLYIAHMFHLGNNREALVSGHFEAWAYGPVNPTLYHHAKIFGSSPVENIFHTIENLKESEETRTLDEVYKSLEHAAPGKLVAITHWDGGAWSKNYVPGIKGKTIPDEDIREEFDKRQKAARARQN